MAKAKKAKKAKKTAKKSVKKAVKKTAKKAKKAAKKVKKAAKKAAPKKAKKTAKKTAKKAVKKTAGKVKKAAKKAKKAVKKAVARVSADSVPVLAAGSLAHITTTINGEKTDFLCEPRETLLEVLRDKLGLTGTKEGCSNGNCGACSVMLDGRVVDSCIVLAVETEGREVTTIEGIATPEGLHPLQQKFLEHAALQCGICTPGFIVAAKALLDREPNPDEHRIRLWLAGNLCRCTGYDKIIRAVEDAAETMRS